MDGTAAGWGRGGGRLAESCDGDSRLPAIFVQPARRFQVNALKTHRNPSGQIPDECLQILNQEVRLLDDVDERTIDLEIGSKSVLTEEDLLDVFFLPELFKTIGADTDKVKSIIEMIEDARISACGRFSARKKRVAKNDQFYSAWSACHYFETSELDDPETYKFQRGKFLTKRSGNIPAPAAADSAVNFANCNWKDEQGAKKGAIANHVKADLEHRIRILRIQDEVNGEHTFGLLLIFSRDDEKLIEEYKKTVEEDEKKHTEGERPVVVHLFLQEQINDHDYSNVCKIAVEYKRSDHITVSADTFTNADSSSMISSENADRLEFRVKKLNEEIVDIRYKPGQAINDLVRDYDSKIDDIVQLEIDVKCYKVDVKLAEPIEIVLAKVVPKPQDTYGDVFPEQRRVANRLFDRVKYVMGNSELGEHKGGLQAFSGVHYLVLVPIFTTLKTQTAKRIEKCPAPATPLWEHHVMTYHKAYEKKFGIFKKHVLKDKTRLFVIIADESHWGYNWRGAHDTFVNDPDLLKATNLIIVQVSATPYCNLTRHSRVSEKYIHNSSLDSSPTSWEILLNSDNKDVDEELHVVKWYPPTGCAAEKSRYLRFEHFLQSIPSFVRHYFQESDW